MTAVENVWEQLKDTAHEYAVRGHLPTPYEAEMVVTELARRAHLSPFPPRDVIEMYARELIEMIALKG